MNRDKNGRFAKGKVFEKFEGLPEKWCINRRNYPEVQKWFEENGAIRGNKFSNMYSGWMTYYPADASGSHTNPFSFKGYTEITIEQFRKYVLKEKEKEFVLPERWYVLWRDKNDTAVCNDFYGKSWVYYEGSGCSSDRCNSNYWSYVDKSIPSYTRITWEQFEKYVMKLKEFTLPEKWCVAVTPSNVSVLEAWRTDHIIACTGGYVMYPGFAERFGQSGQSHKRGYWVASKPAGVTEITFEQFKKYVLKQEETKMEKKIIAYKLIKPEYHDAALSIAKAPSWAATRASNAHLDAGSLAEGYLRDAGVLDTWFTPVYENETPDISIRGYKAEFRPAAVTFGCKTFTKTEVLQLVSILTSAGFVIKDWHNQVLAVAHYFKNQK